MGSSEKDRGLPEGAVRLLRSRLKAHGLWDSLLIFLPPLGALAYLATFLRPSDPEPQRGLAVAAIAILGLFLALAFWRYRPRSPTAPQAARLIDHKVEGKERFVTLATLDPALGASSLVERLRREASALLHRLDVKKDFPYRPKRSFFTSAIGSLIILLLFLFSLEILPFYGPPRPSARDLTLLARRLSQEPRFAEVARSLEELAAKLKDPSLSEKEKQALVQQLLKQVEQQQAAEKRQGGSGSEPLNQAADALRQLGEGGERKEEQKGGGGELKTNLPEQGQGEKKSSGEESGGEAQDASAMGNKQPKEGKSAQGEKRDGTNQGKQRGAGKSEGTEKGREQKKDSQGGAMQAGEGGKQGEEIPSGGPPAERFAKPGKEGAGGLKGARFVTVELPEQETGSGSGEGSTKRRKNQPAPPVGNTPLRRPDSPELAPEKQPLPLEYRGLIR